jgi:hypothetical protein
MTLIMFVYYLMTAYLAGLLLWNFFREKKDLQSMILYLLVLVPLVLRLLRIK